MATVTKTYNPKEVEIACGDVIIHGYAEDSFVTISPMGEGITSKTGCDGEVVRSISPNRQREIRLVLHHYSESNAWFKNMMNQDIENGDAIFSITITDVCGSLVFNADEAWVSNFADTNFGREAGNREWVIHTADAKETE